MSKQANSQDRKAATPQDRQLEDSELNSVSGGKESITFEYGGLIITYTAQKPDGTLK